jgi:hypothetical protein
MLTDTGVTNSAGLFTNVAHNAFTQGVYYDGSGYAHGFLSHGYLGDDGRSIDIGTMSGSDTSVATFIRHHSFYPSGSVVFNEQGYDADFRVESDTNTHALFVDAGNSSVSIGTSTPGPASSLTVTGIVRPNLGIVSVNQIQGFVAGNYSGTRYWVLHDMTGNPTTAFNCIGDVHASSYTTWNVSRVYMRREYNTYNCYGSITGVANSSVTVSIVDITYGANRYFALKFAGGDPGIEANLVGYLMNQMYSGNDALFINGTAGVTENAVIASYP